MVDGRYSAKDPSEIEVYEVSFQKRLGHGETLTSVNSECIVVTGNDPSASGMLVGAPSISGTLVRQVVQNGLDGVTYHIKFTVNTSTGRKLVGVGELPVETD